MLKSVALLFALAGLAQAAAVDQPNIVFILTDDLGWKDVSYQGSKTMETPNIDALAKQGMVFSDAYVGGANCAPSRACLISGTYTPRHGVYAVKSTDRGNKHRQRLVPIPNHDGLTNDCVTMAEGLKAGGYATGHFGKWHLTCDDGTGLPSQQGFDVTFDSFGTKELNEGHEGNEKGPPDDPKGVFILTRKACDFMTANKDKPFFVYLAHHSIHYPLQARPETLARFKTQGKGGQQASAMYAACTYDMDASVGQLLKHIDALGLTDKTLVVFTSDNGAVQESTQEPLRGSKGGYYEGGIREPFIVRWPGVTKPGSVSTVPIMTIDLFPTFLAAAGITPPAGKVLDGENLLPVLRANGDLKRKALFWHFPGYLDRPVNRGRPQDVTGGFRSRPVSVIRKGDFKLHLFWEEWQLDGGKEKLNTNKAVELYDLSKDIGERNDIALTNIAKRDELLADLLAWLEETKAPIPTQRNPSFGPKAR